MQTKTLLREARKAVLRTFGFAGGMVRKKFKLKPLKMDEEQVQLGASMKFTKEEDTRPAAIQHETPAIKNPTKTSGFRDSTSSRPRKHSDLEDMSEAFDEPRVEPELRSPRVPQEPTADLESRQFIERSRSNLDRKLKQHSLQTSNQNELMHGQAFKVFEDEYEEAASTESHTDRQFGFGKRVFGKFDRKQEQLREFQPKQSRRITDAEDWHAELQEPDRKRARMDFKRNEQVDLSETHKLSELAAQFSDEYMPKSKKEPNLQESNRQSESLNHSDLSIDLPKRGHIVVFDQEELSELDPAATIPMEAPETKQPEPKVDEPSKKPLFKFGKAPSTNAPQSDKPSLHVKSSKSATVAQDTSRLPVFTFKKPDLNQAPAESQNKETDKESPTLGAVFSIKNDDDAEKVWHKFTSLRDEMFHEAEHELTQPQKLEDEDSETGASNLNLLALKHPFESNELLERFVPFSSWVKQVLLGSTHQLQSHFEEQEMNSRGNQPTKSKTSTRFSTSVTEGAYNPNDSLYFQSFLRGVEEVVYSLLEHQKAAEERQSPLNSDKTAETSEADPKINNLNKINNLKRPLIAVKKALVYFQIETKSRGDIEELLGLANQLLAESTTSEQRMNEYFVRYPQLLQSTRVIKYRPLNRPEDSQIDLVLKQLLKRQDDLFQIRKGVPKLVALLRRLGRVYGRYEHPTIFIHHFEAVTFAAEFAECIVDGILESKKPKPISLLVDLLGCLHDLRSVSKGGRSTKFTSVLLNALEASRNKMFVTDIVNIYTKWTLMHSSTEMNEYTLQTERATDLLLVLYKDTAEFKNGQIPFSKHLSMLHAISKSKVMDKEILFETLQAFLQEGLEALDYNLAHYRRFFRALSLNYFVIAEEPKLLNLLYEHITAQLPEVAEGLKRSPDARDRRYSAISILYSLATMFPADKIGLHAEYLLGQVKQDIEDSLIQGYSKPEILMLGGILELMKGVWTFPGDVGVKIIQQVKMPGFFRPPTPSMAAFEIAELLGKLHIKHRMEVNLGHMVVDIIVESTFSGEIELAIDVHGPPHEFRNCPITLGNQQFKSRLLANAGIGYFQIPLHVWSLLDTSGKKSYLLKGVSVLREKGSGIVDDPARNVADASKITLKKLRKKSPAKDAQGADEDAKPAKKTRKSKKASSESTENRLGSIDESSTAAGEVITKPKRVRKAKKDELQSKDAAQEDGTKVSEQAMEEVKPKRKHKTISNEDSKTESTSEKPKRARKQKSQASISEPQAQELLPPSDPKEQMK